MVCENCGSTYDVTKVKLMSRDKDSYDCDVCGKELHSWNGATMFIFKLKERGTSPAEPGSTPVQR